MVRQAGRQIIFLKFANFSSKVHLDCVNGFMALTHGFVPINIDIVMASIWRKCDYAIVFQRQKAI